MREASRVRAGSRRDVPQTATTLSSVRSAESPDVMSAESERPLV